MGPKKGHGSEQCNKSLLSRSARRSDDITREGSDREAEELGRNTFALLSNTAHLLPRVLSLLHQCFPIYFRLLMIWAPNSMECPVVWVGCRESENEVPPRERGSSLVMRIRATSWDCRVKSVRKTHSGRNASNRKLWFRELYSHQVYFGQGFSYHFSFWWQEAQNSLK